MVVQMMVEKDDDGGGGGGDHDGSKETPPYWAVTFHPNIGTLLHRGQLDPSVGFLTTRFEI